MQLKGKSPKVLPLILVEGYIGEGEELDYAPFVAALQRIKESGHSKAKLRINCGGGSILSGFAMYDAAQESGLEFEVQIIGIAASMGSILSQIAQPGKRFMSKNAFLMTHRGSGKVEGDADKMQAYADNLRKLESRAAAIYADRTGKSEQVVMSELMVSGIDKWMTADEAKEYGLIDEIIDPVNPLVVPEMKSNKDVATMVMMYKTNPHIMLKPDLLARLGLPENASAAEIEAAVEKNLGDIATMKAAQIAKEEQEATAMVESAITDGVIDAKDKDAVMAQVKLNPAGAKAMLMMVKKPAAQQPVPEMRTLFTPEQKASDDRKDWSLTDWQKKDAAGLLKMKAEKPTDFQALVAKSGVKISGQE